MRPPELDGHAVSQNFLIVLQVRRQNAKYLENPQSHHNFS